MYPSRWSSVSSVRSELPSTRYMILSGPEPSPGLLLDAPAQPVAERGGLFGETQTEQGATENELSRTHV